MKTGIRTMQRWQPFLIVGLCVFVVTAIAVKGGLKTNVIGKVNGDYRIVTAEGKEYEVAENAAGNEMVQLVGKIVKVKGKIKDEMGTKIIIVSTYKIIDG